MTLDGIKRKPKSTANRATAPPAISEVQTALPKRPITDTLRLTAAHLVCILYFAFILFLPLLGGPAVIWYIHDNSPPVRFATLEVLPFFLLALYLTYGAPARYVDEKASRLAYREQ